MKLVIRNAQGVAVPCKSGTCFGFVFEKNAEGTITCSRCSMVHVLASGETEGVFPRPGREYLDRLNTLPSFSFLKDNEGNVRRVEMISGNWKEGDAVRSIMEEAQEEINSLKARLARLTPRSVS